MTAKTGVLSQFPRSFWAANTMEIFERMGWYGFYAVSSLYLTGAVEIALHVWRRDAGVLASREVELVPGIDNLRIYGAAEDASGLYVFTGRPSLVFRLAGDPLEGRWDLVAGPYDGLISQLMIMDDGSLLVFDGIMDHISLRRPH